MTVKVLDVLAGRADAAVECGDALDLMPTLPESSVDLIVADPPYFRVKSEWWDRQWDTAEGFLAWIGSLCRECRRVLKPNGSLYLFASPGRAARVEVEVGRAFRVLNRITWRKADGWARRQCKEEQRAYFPASEAIIFAEQYGADHSADDEAGYGLQCQELHKRVYGPVVGEAVKKKRVAAGLERHQVDSACSPSRKPTGLCYRWEAGDCLPTESQFLALCRLCGDDRPDEALRQEYEALRQEYEALRQEYEALRQEYEALRQEYEALRRPFNVSADVPHTDVWDFPTVSPEQAKHPCEKPLAMMHHIIAASSLTGAVVLDPTCGSGSTLVAAKESGRRAIGFDVEEKWVRRSLRRVSQGVFAW